MKFRNIIDLAIGSRDVGHVDFQALHFLLSSFAERLNIIEEDVEYNRSSDVSLSNISDWDANKITAELYAIQGGKRVAKRLKAGADEEGAAPAEESPEAEAAAPPAEEAPQEEKPPSQEPKEQTQESAPPEPAEVEVEEPKRAPTTDLDEIEEPPMQIDGGIDGTELMAVDGGSPVDFREWQGEPISPENLKLGVCMMKDQLELAMEQLTLLTEYLLEKRQDLKKMSVLGKYLRKLRNIMRQNIFFESCFHRDDSISWHSDEECDEEGMEEGYAYRPPKPIIEEPFKPEPEPQEVPEICKDDLGIEPCLAYTADQLLDMFLDMRSEFCQLANKVNTIASTILEQDYHGLMAMTANIQKQQEEMLASIRELKYKFVTAELKISSILRNIEKIILDVEELREKKADRDEVLCWLSKKVNYEDLEKKVDKTELIAFQQEIAKMFCDFRGMINTNEKNIMSIVDNLRESLGVNFLENLLYSMREKFQNDIDMLNAKLDHYIAMTDDECAAASARVKVLKDLKCLSCDTACVMRKLDRGRIGKMPSAHPGQMTGALVTYELSKIRKAGIAGLYRKDDLPKSAKEYFKKHEDMVNLDKCKPRHTGGAHTATTRREFTEKVMGGGRKKQCSDMK